LLNEGAAVAELSDLQARQRDAHLQADAAGLVALFADDFVSVQDGDVSRPSRPDSLRRFERYFAQVSFVAWDDLEPPVIEVSGDGTLATVLVHKLVHLTYRDAAGSQAQEITVFAWAETWRRARDRWELAMVVSTRKDAG
jgi:ketosteroid isomerase-like protein